MKIRRLFAGLCFVWIASAATSAKAAVQGIALQDLATAGEHDFLSGNYSSAARYYQEALDLAQERKAPASTRVNLMVSLAQSYLARTRYKESEDWFNQAMKIADKEIIDPQVETILLMGLGSLYTQTQRATLAEPPLQKALKLSRSAFGSESPQTANAFKNLGIVYGLTGRLSAAEESLKKSLAIQEKYLATDYAEVAAILSSLAGVYTLRKNWKEAEPLFVRSVELIELAVGPNHPELAAPLANLAEFYSVRGDFIGAERELRRALDIRLKALGSDNMGVAVFAARLASILTHLERYDEAKTMFLSSLAVQERLDGSTSPVFVSTLEQYALLLRKMENPRQAEIFETRAKNVRTELLYTVPAADLGR